MQIYLTFKNNKDDKELYEWICKHNNKSGFIKDVMREKMENELLEKFKSNNGLYIQK